MISILRSNVVSILPCSLLFLNPLSVALIHFSFALEQGSPTSGPPISTSCQISGGIRLVHLNHPKITASPLWPPLAHGKTVFRESAPGDKKVGDHCFQFSSVQSLSRVQLFATPWITARQASLSITHSQSSLRLTSIESVMPSSHLILCCPLLLLPPIPPSIRVFSNESTLRRRWAKYWSFSLEGVIISLHVFLYQKVFMTCC